MKKAYGDVIILHICTENHDHMMHSSWNLRHDRGFCHFGPFFALLPPKNLGNQNFEKIKKMTGHIIILHMCTINENHDLCFKTLLEILSFYNCVPRMTIIWCMISETWSVTDRILLFLPNFCPFTLKACVCYFFIKFLFFH